VVALCASRPADAYVPDERWTFTASGSTGAEGSPITLTWGFARDGVAIPGEASSNLISFLDEVFGAGPTGADITQRPWFDLFDNSFNRWAELAGVTFIYEPNDDARRLTSAGGIRNVRADLRIGGANIDGFSGTLAYTHLPNNGDMVIDTDDKSFFADSGDNYRHFRNTLMHEIGHALGILHVESSSSALLLEPFIDSSFDGPQLDDIRGIHAFYGDVWERTNAGLGNQTVALATDLGALSVGGSLAIGTDALGNSQAVAASEIDFVSITNSADADYFSFSVPAPMTLGVTLTPLGGTFTQGTEDGQQATFNANARNDLSLSLFDQNGTTILASANSAVAGQPESFSGINLSTAGEYFLRIAGASDSVQLYQLALSATRPIQLLAGDYNLDGRVDAADYVVWRNTLGQAGTTLAADGNNNGIIDIADLSVWRSNFAAIVQSASATLPNGLAAPEPGTSWSLTMAFSLLLLIRIRSNNDLYHFREPTKSGGSRGHEPPRRRRTTLYRFVSDYLTFTVQFPSP
jgi:hypothetical protein